VDWILFLGRLYTVVHGFADWQSGDSNTTSGAWSRSDGHN